MATTHDGPAAPSLSQWRALKAYTIVSTTIVGLLALTAFTQARQKQRFTEIDVERINVVEKDGKLRMTISNAARSPGWVFHGKLFPGRPKTAGMIFFNDEGEENGGFIYGGRKENGKVNAGMSLTFDQYDSDQIVALQYNDEEGRRRNGLQILDRPDIPISEIAEAYKAMEKLGPAARDSAQKAFLARAGGQPLAAQRLYVGRDRQKASVVDLADRAGKPRLRLNVDSLGAASIEFLDAAGKVTKRITGE